MKRIFAAAISLCLAFPAFAHDKDYVRCVQNQIVELGQDPGPIDGLMGSRTRGALQKALGDNPLLSDLTEDKALSKRTAGTWCRKLGALKADLRQYMPSRALMVEPGEDGIQDTQQAAQLRFGNINGLGAEIVTTAEDTDDILSAGLEEALSEARDYFRRVHDIELASHITIVGGIKPNDLIKELNTLRKKYNRLSPISNRYIRERCNLKETAIFAFANRHDIAFCFGPDTEFDALWRGSFQPFLNFIMVHEYFHHIQREFTNDKAEIPRRTDRRPIMGPEWMVEGSAVYFENKYLAERYDRHSPLYTSYFQAKDTKATLRSMRRRGVVRTDEEYNTSSFAAELLARRYGDAALIEFWRQVGQGLSWERAFAATFDMPLTEFEKTFEDIRGDFKAVADFASAKG